jgi:hypothetical protein
VIAWGGVTLWTSCLDVFQPDSATRLAYDWLKSDLQLIKWVP